MDSTSEDQETQEKTAFKQGYRYGWWQGALVTFFLYTGLVFLIAGYVPLP
jgi:hypothetical protein